MSVKIMSLIWERAPYTAGSLLVLLALADWSNDSGVSWPSMERLARKARIDKRSAQRIVRQLAKDGTIQIDEGGGRGKQHRYLIQIETVTNCHPLTEETVTPTSPIPEIKDDISNTERVTFEAERVTSDTQTVTPMSPDPLEEPLEEPSVKPPTHTSRARFVFDEWKRILNHPKAKPDKKRMKAINARLRDYVVEDLILAIKGCAASPYHMGQNEHQSVYDDIELICRDGEHVERFIARAEIGNGNGHRPKTQSERNVTNLKASIEYIRSQRTSSNDDSEESASVLST